MKLILIGDTAKSAIEFHEVHDIVLRMYELCYVWMYMGAPLRPTGRGAGSSI